jgi:tripartite-type tricarboxylate transporter receptor subunit TctC
MSKKILPFPQIDKPAALFKDGCRCFNASGLPLMAQASYPNKSMKMIVPFPPGGGTDTVARALAQRLSAALGHAVIVDNKAGAGTTIGLAEVARAAPDGYTMGIGGNSDPLLPLLYDNLSFNRSQDLVFVSTLASSPIAFAVGNNVPAKNIREFISYAKSRSSSPLAYASVGITSPHASCRHSFFCHDWRTTGSCTVSGYQSSVERSAGRAHSRRHARAPFPIAARP